MIRGRQRANRRALTRRERKLILLGALAFIALVLGFIGYLRRSYSVPDAAYASLQLFGFSMAQPRDVPLELDLARFLAPIALGYAVFEALGALLRDQLEGLRAMTKRNHVVIAGLGDAGLGMAETLSEASERVVAIERVSSKDAIRRVRDRGVLTVQGDARDSVILRRAGVASADYLLVACGNDEVNVDVAQCARELMRERPRPLKVIVHLAEAGTRRLLSAQAIADSAAEQRTRIEYFNLRETAARALAASRSPWAAGNGVAAHPHAVIAGIDGVAEELVVRLGTIAASRPPDASRLRVSLVAHGASALRERLASEHPGLGHVAQVDAVETSTGALATLEFEGGLPVTAAYVCLDSQIEALEAALALTRRSDVFGSVVLTVEHEDSGIAVALQSGRGALSRVKIFGVFEAALTPELLRDGVTETLARAKHEHYLLCEYERGTPPAANPSMVAWEQLDDETRESNRAFADAVGDKLASLGCMLVPAHVGPTTGPLYEVPENVVEALGIEEHNRWMADASRRGLRTTTGARDVGRGLHPDLVPWEELSEDVRDKDREPVRDLPLILRQAGLAVVPGGTRTRD